MLESQDLNPVRLTSKLDLLTNGYRRLTRFKAIVDDDQYHRTDFNTVNI